MTGTDQPTRAGHTLDPPGTYAPRPGAAPLPRMIVVQARQELRLLARNGEQLVLALVIPVLVLVVGTLAAEHLGIGGIRPVESLAPGVFALAVMSTSFTSLAIATGFERRYGVLKRLGATPLPRAGLLAGKIASLLVMQVGQLTLLVVVAVLLGWRPHVGPALAVAVLLWWLGTAAFAAWALTMAGSLRAEATLALANLVFVLLVVGGGVVAPASSYGPAGWLVRLLPSGALADGLRQALSVGRVDAGALIVLAVWVAAGVVAAARWFRWE